MLTKITDLLVHGYHFLAIFESGANEMFMIEK